MDEANNQDRKLCEVGDVKVYGEQASSRCLATLFGWAENIREDDKKELQPTKTLNKLRYRTVAVVNMLHSNGGAIGRGHLAYVRWLAEPMTFCMTTCTRRLPVECGLDVG